VQSGMTVGVSGGPAMVAPMTLQPEVLRGGASVGSGKGAVDDIRRKSGQTGRREHKADKGENGSGEA
jgi:hypothetical protein